MIRTQVQFTEEQYKKLKEISQNNQKSLSAVIRQAVDQLLVTRKPDRQALYRHAGSLVGKYKADKTDIAAAHDKYLDEAFGQ
jgi:metal-responsive CopG/Arc/MetJ family transcriptional regulator